MPETLSSDAAGAPETAAAGCRTLPALVGRIAGFGERAAMIACGEGEGEIETWSYTRLAATAHGLAAGLHEAGVGRGEPIALLAPNGPLWVLCYFAIVSAGAMAVPLDDLTRDRELGRQLSHCGCRRIFTTRRHLDALRGLEGGAELDVTLLDDADGAAGARDWRALLAEPRPLPEPAADAPASLLFTSGTTGTPKAVPLTHRNILANLEALLAEPLVGAEDRVLLPLPLHHAYPFTVGMLGTLASGATLVFPAGLAGPQIVAALRATGASVIVGVPRLYTAILAGIEGKAAGRGGLPAALFPRLLALSTWLRRRLGLRLGRRLFRRLHAEIGPELRLLASGGAHLDTATAWRLEGLGWEVLTGYGLTETAPILTFNRRGRARLGTEGLPVAGVELRIDAAAGAAFGEVLARGPNVFAGYWDNEPATRAAFTADGMFRTGDLGALDPDGYLTIVGRTKEMIVLPGGLNVFPEDVEAVYAESPFIRDVAVLERGGALVALVMPDSDAIRERGAARFAALLRDEIEARSQHLPGSLRLSGFAVAREALPRTHLGKLRRHLLPEIYGRAERGSGAIAAAPSAEDQAMLERPPIREIWAWLAARFPGRELSLDTSPQLDLGIDSLAWTGLTLEIEERFGIALTDRALARVVTLRDLLHEATKAEVQARPAGGARHLTAEEARWLHHPGPALTVLGLVLYWLNRAVMRGLFRLRVEGLERLPATGPLVLAPNHASFLDPFAVAAALPWRRLRRTWWAGWTGRLFTNPAVRLFSRAAQIVPVDPDRGPAAALAFGMWILERGNTLIWFPEGRRSPTGELLPFLPGVGLLLARSGAPAVPARIFGSFAALPRGRRLPRLRRLTVLFGRPLGPADIAAVPGAESFERIAEALHDAVAALAPTRKD